MCFEVVKENKMKKIMCLLFILTAFAGFITVPAQAFDLKIQHNTPPENSAWHNGFLQLKADLEEKFKDEANITIYPAGALAKGNWVTIMEQTQSNIVQMMCESHVPLGTVVPEISAMSTPFLFDGMDHQMNFFDMKPPILQKWMKKFEEKNMVCVGWWPRPSRQNINSERKIITPEDIQGMKFRSMGVPLAIKTWNAMGAKPVPLPSGEIYTAIQLGTVSGEDNAISTVYNAKTYEPCKYFNVWDYMADGAFIVVNKSWWDELKPEVQNAITESINGKARDVVYKYYVQKEKEGREKMEEYGIIFTDFSPEMKKPWIDLMGPVYDYVKELVGGEESWNEFKKAVDFTR